MLSRRPFVVGSRHLFGMGECASEACTSHQMDWRSDFSSECFAFFLDERRPSPCAQERRDGQTVARINHPDITAGGYATSRARTSSSRARSLLRMTHTTADNPPSTWSSTPVMNDAAGDARKSTAAATSAASP
jgi:hypothetical protein